MGITLLQMKHVLDMLSEACMLGCKVIDAPMKTNVKLLADHEELLDNPSRYHQLVNKLNCLMVTRHDTVFVVSFVS